MYFTDKEDLFRYLMENYGRMLEERLGQLLDQAEGDLFAAFLDLFDDIRAQWESGACRELASIVRRNRQMQPGPSWIGGGLRRSWIACGTEWLCPDWI